MGFLIDVYTPIGNFRVTNQLAPSFWKTLTLPERTVSLTQVIASELVAPLQVRSSPRHLQRVTVPDLRAHPLDAAGGCFPDRGKTRVSQSRCIVFQDRCA